MSRRVLVIEPDDAARGLVRRALSTDGHVVVAARSIDDVDDAEGAFDAAIVDEMAGSGALLDEVRRAQRRWPNAALVVTGTLTTPALLLQIFRLGARDALPKPFSPVELRAAIARVIERSAAGHDLAVSFGAAIAEARDAIGRGEPRSARAPLAIAHAAVPLDAEAMALEALVAELDGRDDDADRGYRAALALRREEDVPPPDPGGALARLAAYAGAAPASLLPASFDGAPVWLVSDARELAEAAPPSIAADARHVVLMALGISCDAPASYFRAGAARAFVLVAAVDRSEAIAAALARTAAGAVVVADATSTPFDVARIELLRARTRDDAAVAP